MSFELWLTWFAACWVISLTPGAGVVATLSSATRGYLPALQLILGLQLGAFLHVVVAAAGLGALLAASPWAFELLRWLGAGYLLWLAVQQWRAPAVPLDANAEPALHGGRTRFLRGFLVNASNPKAVLFVMAVFPQFLRPDLPLLPQYTVLTITMSLVDVMGMSLYALVATRMSGLLRSRTGLRRLNRGFATLFAGAAGLMLAMGRATG